MKTQSFGQRKSQFIQAVQNRIERDVTADSEDQEVSDTLSQQTRPPTQQTSKLAESTKKPLEQRKKEYFKDVRDRKYARRTNRDTI